ncbi:MAG: transketolase [Arenicella sp.]
MNRPEVTDQTLANAIRFLSMDAVQKANSGHPGAPMGMADIAQVLWRKFLRHNPKNPQWYNRDRFVLSNGHGSMLLYSLLHLSGYDLPITELKNFRQLHSKTPGHPEYGLTPGVETTTGPLGQGLANAVGMALAEKTLAKQFNRPGLEILDHHTYCFVGDGCLMEGISHEVCSLAGVLKLGKLIVIYDDNGISIDGDVKGWFKDDTPERFRAYGWQVLEPINGHDPQAIAQSLDVAKKETNKPTLICCKTIIGSGSPNKAGGHECHGAPLGDSEIIETRRALSWPYKAFEIPEEVYAAWNAVEPGNHAESQWNSVFAEYQLQHPELAKEFKRRLNGNLPENWRITAQELLKQSQLKTTQQATRKSSQAVLETIGKQLPELLGGSADLAPSNLTQWSGSKAISAKHAGGNYVHYGVREFGMSAMINGIALYGGFLPYGGTFLMFMEYARNAIRMSALMGTRSIFIYTHDSIGLGEDGPTHQPIEQLASLRQTPNLETWRPCDDVETMASWLVAIERKEGPSALVLSRQSLPSNERDNDQLPLIYKGGYILRDYIHKPQSIDEDSLDIILLAAGSEIELAVASAQILHQKGFNVRIVSMPCIERFEKQDTTYKNKVLPDSIRARVAIEMAHPAPWHSFVGLDGDILGINTFGESAPVDDLKVYFGFTIERVVKMANDVLTKTATTE